MVSQETAWLPAWLQPHRMSPLSEEKRDTDALVEVTNGLQETPSNGKPFSRGSATCTSSCLFLSGEDECSASNSISIENVTPFQLYLSSGSSGQHLSPLPEKYGGETFPYNGPSLACILESSVLENNVEPQIPLADPMINDMQIKVSSTGPQSGSSRHFKRHSGGHHASTIMLKDDDVDNAVELAVAASEALVLSDIVSNSVPSHAFSTSTILEVALRLKEARIKSCINKQNTPIISYEEVDEIPSLSDLDEDIMADAFCDVGLTVKKVGTGHNLLSPGFANPSAETRKTDLPPANMAKIVSDIQVPGTGLDAHLAEGVSSFSKEGFNFSASSTPTHISESPVGSVSNIHNYVASQEINSWGTFNKRIETATSAGTRYLAKIRSPVTLDTPSGSSKRSKELYLTGRFGSNNLKATPTSLSAIRDPGNGILEKAMLVEPFCSRWLGGWTGKEINMDTASLEHLESQTTTSTPSWVQEFRDVRAEHAEMTDSPESSADHWHDTPDSKLVVQKGCNNTRGKSRFFVEETSFLSESVAELDEDAAVNKTERCIADGPDLNNALCAFLLPLETLGSSNRVSNFGHQSLSSPSSSLDDPLCSVVECSIPGEEANLRAASTMQNLESEGRLGANSTFTGNMDFHALCASASKLTCVEAVEASHLGLQKNNRLVLTSLKNYSTPVPFNKTNLCEHKEANIIKDRPEHQSENYRKLLSEGCCKSLNHEKQSLPVNLCQPTIHHIDSGACSPIKLNGCINDPNEEDRSTVEKQFLTKTVHAVCIEKTLHAVCTDKSGDTNTMHQFDQNNSPSVWRNRTRRRFRPCKPVDKDFNQEHNLIETGETCLRKVSSRRSRKESSCMERQSPSQLEPMKHEQGPVIKKVRFAKNECEPTTRKSSSVIRSCLRQAQKSGKKTKGSSLLAKLRNESECGGYPKADKKILFRGFEFILTGFTKQEKQTLEATLRKHGGIILLDIPSPSSIHMHKKRPIQKGHLLTVILSPRKVRTTKFLYGCATNAYVLKVDWLIDSISVGSPLSPDKYFLSGRNHMDFMSTVSHDEYIFQGVGVMFYGKARFCSRYATLFEHGGGHVFKTLRWLTQNLNSHKIKIGAIVVEDIGHATRHLRHCASEYKLHIKSASWITGSLLSGEVLPLDGSDTDVFCPTREGRIEGLDLSQEI